MRGLKKIKKRHGDTKHRFKIYVLGWSVPQKMKGGDIRTNEMRKTLYTYDWIENDLNRCL